MSPYRTPPESTESTTAESGGIPDADLLPVLLALLVASALRVGSGLAHHERSREIVLALLVMPLVTWLSRDALSWLARRGDRVVARRRLGGPDAGWWGALSSPRRSARAMMRRMGRRGLVITGRVGMAAGVLGALTVIPMLAWPPESPANLVRYPFTLTEFQVIQTWFFVHHLGLVAVVVGLAMSGAGGGGRVARGAGWVAVVGTTLLALMELVTASRFGEWDSKLANEGAMGAGYGVATNLIGVGLVVAGIGVVRARVWTGWERFIPLTAGLMHFLVVTPCLFSGNYVAGRLGIGSWMLAFGALGLALVRDAGRRPASAG